MEILRESIHEDICDLAKIKPNEAEHAKMPGSVFSSLAGLTGAPKCS